MALFARAKKRVVGKELSFSNLSNIINEDNEEEYINNKDNNSLSLFHKENCKPDKTISKSQKIDSHFADINSLNPQSESVTNEVASDNLQDIAFGDHEEVIEESKSIAENNNNHGNNPDFQDLYEESNLMTEEKQDFENNPLSKSFEKSRSSADVRTSQYPPLHRSTSNNVSPRDNALPLMKAPRSTNNDYPADLRFATSRTTSSTTGNSSRSSYDETETFKYKQSSSVDTWDDDSFSAHTFDTLSIDEDEDVIDVLFSKARHNRADYVLAKLRDGFDPLCKDKNGNTLLHICAQNNHRKLASSILKITPNLNINEVNNKSLTPLDYCYKYGFVSMSEWLITKGARNGNSSSQPIASYYR